MCRKIKAFTLMEMMVGLILSAIILTLIWNVFFFLGDYRSIIETKSENQVQIKKAEYQLKRDFERTKKARLESNMLYLNFKKDSVQYLFEENYLVRIKSTITDTINLSAHIRSLENQTYQVCINQTQNTQTPYCFKLAQPFSSTIRLQAE